MSLIGLICHSTIQVEYLGEKAAARVIVPHFSSAAETKETL